MIMRIEWLGHASVLIESDVRLYIDPFQLEGALRADIVCITHTHADHLDLGSLQPIVDENTTIVCSYDAHSRLEKLGPKTIVMMRPGEEVEVGSVRIRATHAYNTDKPFHPKENDWLGFLVELEGMRVFHAGDLDDLPELSEVSCDILFVPVSGTYVMNAEEAARFARRIHHRLAVPIHHGTIIGSQEDAERFVSLIPTGIVPRVGADILERLRS
jgi:L-ascorbate metabolism protein UlaG (beta-lactamase superfamily)